MNLLNFESFHVFLFIIDVVAGVFAVVYCRKSCEHASSVPLVMGNISSEYGGL